MTNNASTTVASRPRRESPESGLRSARLAKGYSQADLAFRSGVSLSWVSVLERQPGLMTQRVADRLAAALGVLPQILLAANASDSALPANTSPARGGLCLPSAPDAAELPPARGEDDR